MNWGWYIFLSFVLFAIFIITLVVRTMQEDVNLVSEDYYQQEMKYQDQIDRIENSAGIDPIDLSVNYEEQVVVFSFPPSLAQKSVEGELYFFRPSNSSLDYRIKLALDPDFTQKVSLRNLSKGMWRVKISWIEGEKGFFQEKVLVL